MDQSFISVSHISKTFGSASATVQAVKDVSFEVAPGEIFGLLGPNGAGKTTSIRILLDLFRPDSGSVSILDGPMTEAKKDRIGYMPEERGLYQDVPLDVCLVYLGNMKGLPEKETRRRLETYLERFDLAAHRKKKVKELSKGMQQKAQIISTVLHQPEVIIVDEPFASLDPLNVQLVKDLFRELRDQGTAILMSTHQMNQVEELCDRLVLIDHGRNVLYGGLDVVRGQFVGHAVVVRLEGNLPDLPEVRSVSEHNSALRLELDASVTPDQALQALVKAGARIKSYEIAIPSLDEIFIKVVGAKDTTSDGAALTISEAEQKETSQVNGAPK